MENYYTIRKRLRAAWKAFVSDPNKPLNTRVEGVTPRKVIESTFPLGAKVKTFCGYCGRYLISEISEAGQTPRTYCGKKCSDRNRIRNRKYRESPLQCPNPDKASFPNSFIAEKYLAAVIKQDPEMVLNNIYACKCGKYHIGRWRFSIVEEE